MNYHCNPIVTCPVCGVKTHGPDHRCDEAKLRRIDAARKRIEDLDDPMNGMPRCWFDRLAEGFLLRSPWVQDYWK